MKCTKLDIPFPFRAQSYREPGLHLSEIIQDLAMTLYPKKYTARFDSLPEDKQAEIRLRMELGFIWEDALAIAFGSGFAPRYDNVERDGIWMNPDGVDIMDGVLYEYKCTSTLSNKSPVDNQLWMWQVKAYCWAFGITTARMYILHIDGDGKYPKHPVWAPWEIEFTLQELEENWMIITNHAKVMQERITE